MPSNRRLQSPPGRTGSLARGSYNSRKRSLGRSRCEHGGVGFGPVGRSGLVRGSGDRVFPVVPSASAVKTRGFPDSPNLSGMELATVAAKFLSLNY